MKFKLSTTPESRPIVGEEMQKSPDSLGGNAKVAPYDLDALLNTSDKAEEPAPIVVEAPVQKDTHKKQSRSEYHKTWAKDKAQISFRIATDLKEQIDQHTKSRKEPLAQFVIRAIKEQIERDNINS